MQQSEYNKSGLYVFLFSMIFVIVFFIYLSFFHPHGSPDHPQMETTGEQTKK